MEIQLYNKNSTVVLTSNDLSIIKAIDSDLANIVSDDVLKSKLIDLVKDSYIIAGFKPPETLRELNLTIDAIVEEMRLNKTNIRVDEIEIAFKNGVHKKYGEYMGLSAVSFCGFIKGYVTEESRLEAIRIKNMPETIKEPSNYEVFEISKTNALSALKDFKKSGTCGRYGDVVFVFLEKIGLINLSIDQKKEYWQKAKSEYEKYLLNARANPVDLNERRKVENAFESFMNGGQTERLKVISRRLVVDDYFLGLGDKDLQGLINQNKPNNTKSL